MVIVRTKIILIAFLVGCVALGFFIYNHKLSAPKQFRNFIELQLNSVFYSFGSSVQTSRFLWISKNSEQFNILTDIAVELHKSEDFKRIYFPGSIGSQIIKVNDTSSWICKISNCVQFSDVNQNLSMPQILNILETDYIINFDEINNVLSISYYSSFDDEAEKRLKIIYNAILQSQYSKLQNRIADLNKQVAMLHQFSSLLDRRKISQLETEIAFLTYMNEGNLVKGGAFVFRDYNDFKPNVFAWSIISVLAPIYLFIHILLIYQRFNSHHRGTSYLFSYFSLRLSITLFFAVVGGFIGFLRDAFSLPLYDGRTELVEMAILLMALAFLGNFALDHQKAIEIKDESIVSKRNSYVIFPILVIPSRVNLFVYIFLSCTFLLFVNSHINGSNNLFFFLQLVNFVLILLFLNFVSCMSLDKKLMENGLYYLVLMILFSLISVYFLKGSGIFANPTDLLGRNGWAAISVFYLYFVGLKSERSIYFLTVLICVFIGIITSSKLALLFIFIHFVSSLFFSQRHISVALKLTLFCTIFGSIITLPFVMPFIFGFEFESLYVWEQYRWAVLDDLESIISRVFSIRHLLENGSLLTFFGHGEVYLDSDKFWGYTVHNLPIILIYSQGVIGWLIAFILILFVILNTNTFWQVVFLTTILMYLNDIVLMLALSMYYATDKPAFLSDADKKPINA